MARSLLAMSIGPVQEFISAARRTRDLWFGSTLLSELSRAAAEVGAKHGELIFPASLEVKNVANVVLVELFAGAAPAEVAAAARKAVQDRWLDKYTAPVFAELGPVIRKQIWDDQVKDVVEFYAAWSSLDPGYEAARKNVMRLLSGRKNCRDFARARGRAGVPKSSLDGMRESVLKDPGVERWPERLRHRLRVREGEQLDVIGLVKRVWQPPGGTSYPSVSRVAADPWLRGRAADLGPLIGACELLNAKHSRPIVRELDTDEYPQYKNFRFEGSVLFRNRHHELIEEEGLTEDDLRPVAAAVARLGEPNPYLAVLVADGDKMGELLSRLTLADDHRAVSLAAAAFATAAKGIVQACRGVLVYAGGDDVLAFLPVDTCLDCARQLHDQFAKTMQQWGVTLSVGVAIGHFLENLEDLREYGKEAEKAAKDLGRDVLAIHLHKRGGDAVKVRAKWTERLDERLTTYARWLRERSIPNRLATDLRQMVDVYRRWDTDAAPAIVRDVLRVIRAKQPGGSSVVKEIEAELCRRVKDAATLRHLAEELLIARQLATAQRQEAGGAEAEEL